VLNEFIWVSSLRALRVLRGEKFFSEMIGFELL